MLARMKAGDLVGGKYRLVRRLGQGAMGVVWEATHEVTSRHVAMKLIVNATDNLRKRLLREARAAGQIAHRNVVEVYDIGETNEGDPFLVMQLLSGETLYACMKREGALDRGRALSILRDICKALVAAHAKGIVHRDLKPANVFLHREAGSTGEIVKVLDFGLCKPMDVEEALTVPGGMLGSPAYMSPEQIMGAADLDLRTDIWTLGVVIFELVSGKRPFAGRGPDLIHAVLSDPIPRLRDVVATVDPELDELVAHCISRDRNTRIGSASEVLARLEAIATREGQRERAPAGSQGHDADDGEMAMTLLYRPGQLQASVAAAAERRITQTQPLAGSSLGRPPPVDLGPRSAPSNAPAPWGAPSSQPEPALSGSGPWSQSRGGAPDSSPSSTPQSAQRGSFASAPPMSGTVPMPRVTAAQAESWAQQQRAQAAPQQAPQHQPWPNQVDRPPPEPWPNQVDRSPPAAPQKTQFGIVVGIGVLLVALLGAGLYFGLSGANNAAPGNATPTAPSMKPSR